MQQMEQFLDITGTWVIGIIIILAGMIKIPPIQINFWSWLGRLVGRAINGEVLEKFDGISKDVDSLTKDLDDLRKEEEVERVRQARQRILRFSDEILFEQRHSKEHFDEILEDIDLYEKYCHEHQEYENNRADLAIATIREIYKKCLQTHDFLIRTKKEI